MKFPHSYRGVKLIFIAEIISIVASIIALVAASLASAAINGSSEATAASATLLLVSGLASIMVFVFQLVGLFHGARDSREFRIALWIVFIGIAVSIASSILQSLDATKGLPIIVFAILSTVAAVADFLVVICVLFGISSLADRLGYDEMGDKGRRLAFYIVIIYMISLILGFTPGFNGYIVNPGWRLMFSIFGIVAAALEIIIYINIVIYLYRATKMLEK